MCLYQHPEGDRQKAHISSNLRWEVVRNCLFIASQKTGKWKMASQKSLTSLPFSHILEGPHGIMPRFKFTLVQTFTRVVCVNTCKVAKATQHRLPLCYQERKRKDFHTRMFNFKSPSTQQFLLHLYSLILTFNSWIHLEYVYSEWVFFRNILNRKRDISSPKDVHSSSICDCKI